MRRPFVRLALVLAIGIALLSTAPSAARQAGSVRQGTPTNVTAITAAEFFAPAKVWTASLTMSAEAWAAMQPRRDASSGGRRSGGNPFLGPRGARNGTAARQGVEFDYVHATLQINTWTFRDVAVRYKGNHSYFRATRNGGDKISLKVDLNKYVKGQKLAGLTTINFQNNILDSGRMNEVLAYRLYRDAGALAPRTTYAQVYLTVEGQLTKRYLGLYSVSENVDENFVEDRFGTRQGAIFKPVTRELFTDWGPHWTAYDQAYDPKTDLTEAQRQRVIALGRLVSGATDEEFAAKIGDYVDLDDFAEYSAVLVWLANRDNAFETGQNVYVYLHPVTNWMYFIAWDQDFSFGTVRDKMGTLSIHSRWSGHPFLSRLHAVDAFRSKYLARMSEFSERLFVPERFMRQISEIAPALRPSIELEGPQSLTAFDEVARGRAGIVPNATSRAAIVKAELEKGAQ